MIWLDTFWSSASDAPNPTLEACAQPQPQGPQSISFGEWAHCVWPFSVPDTYGCGGASVVTRLSCFPEHKPRLWKDKVTDESFRSIRNTVSSQRFQDVFRGTRAPHSPLVCSLRNKFIIPVVHAPWENESEFMHLPTSVEPEARSL